MYQSVPFQYGVKGRPERVVTDSAEVEYLQEDIVWEDAECHFTVMNTVYNSDRLCMRH